MADTCRTCAGSRVIVRYPNRLPCPDCTPAPCVSCGKEAFGKTCGAVECDRVWANGEFA